MDEKICGNCAFWENRPEGQMDNNTGYCRMKDIIKTRKANCSKFKNKRFGRPTDPLNMLMEMEEEFLDIQDA
jgi:hypothetical protein